MHVRMCGKKVNSTFRSKCFMLSDTHRMATQHGTTSHIH